MFKQARRKKQQKQFASLKNSTTLAEMDEELWQDESEENGMLKKGPWTAVEDAILIAYVNKHGEGNWNSVQKYSGLSRCGKSCRLRWANHLRPNLKKDAFSIDEERLIINLHAKLGNKWARMATQLPGRTDNEIKNYWNTRIKRRIRAGLPVYPLDPRVDSSEEKIKSGSPITSFNSFSPGSSDNSTNESPRHLKRIKFRPPPFQYDCVAFPISTSSPYLRIDQTYLSSQPKPVENTSFFANPHDIQYESSKTKDVLSSHNVGLLEDVRSLELQQNKKENMDKLLDDTTNAEIKIQEYTTLSSESTNAKESTAMASNGSYIDEEELSTLLDFTRQENASLTGLCITNSETQMSYTALEDVLCNSDIATNNNILENNVLSSQVWDTHISDFKSWFFNDQMHDSFAIF